MRLGQLSRKLSVRTSDIVEYLSTKGIQLDNDSNMRLDDEHVMLIVQHFAPGLSAEESIDVRQEPDGQEKEPEENKGVSFAPPVESIATAQQEGEEEIQDAVIKAPKIELSGLKILGKIDLPERKKKETPSDTGQSVPQDAAAIEKQKRSDGRRSLRGDQRKGTRKNPIALQREQEAAEAEKKRQERAQQQKEKRTQNYLRRVKAAAPTKSARLVEEPTEELLKIEERPTTLLGRFLRWLKK